MKYEIRDRTLSGKGESRIAWADKNMPVLKLIRERFENERPLEGMRVSCCLHVTTETANLLRTLKSGGAEVTLCASNPLSTQDDVAASLVFDYQIPVFALNGENDDEYYSHIDSALDVSPHVTMDDGADLISTLHAKRKELIGGVLGGTEETTTGVIRLRAMERDGVLRYPIVAVNDSDTKHLFDNKYGTGQSTIDGILRATNLLMAGSTFVVAGYGWCGRGVAERAQGMGAKVVVTEVNPVRALQALMDGYTVMPMSEAAEVGDVFVTTTGDIDVLNSSHFEHMKNGAILANSGHFDVEIDKKGLRRMSASVRQVRDFVEEYTLEDGKRIYLLAQGRLVNLSAAEGHPASVMDMSFANQALAAEYIKKESTNLEPKVYKLPAELDTEIAKLKLSSLGVSIDQLSDSQEKYLKSWELGT